MASSWNNPALKNYIRNDVPEIQKLLVSLSKFRPDVEPDGSTAIGNIPVGARRLMDVTGGKQFQQWTSGNKWESIGKLIHDADTLDSYHASTTAIANAIPVYNSSKKLPCDITGNAASASKIKDPVTIEIGGIVSANSATFDGSSSISIPINRIDVNNTDDTAVNGTLSAAHGGTGRTDGAASDVVVSSPSGTVKASAYGQVGASKLITSSLNSLVVPGKYQSASGTMANGYPETVSYPSYIEVIQQGTNIMQRITYQDVNGTKYAEWVRSSTDTGANWGRWHCLRGNNAGSALVLYVSASGIDTRTGLNASYAVQTIARALEIANAYARGTNLGAVNLYVGSGNFGAVSFSNLPYKVYIRPIDGKTATGYVSSLPAFTSISADNTVVDVCGVVVNSVVAYNGGIVYFPAGYNRVGALRAYYNGSIMFAKDSNYYIDVVSQSTQTGYVMCADHNGMFDCSNARKFKVINSLAVTYFLRAYNFGMLDVTGATFELSSGVTITGTRYSFLATSDFYGTVSKIPAATTAGSFSTGCTVNGVPYGDATTSKFLRADGNYSSSLTGDFSVGGVATVSKSVTTPFITLNAGSTKVDGTITAQISGSMGANDAWRIGVGATASDAGFLEIATADNGKEPIYVRQYSGAFATLVKSATLLDASGNTSFPGTVTATKFSGPLTGNVTGNVTGNLTGDVTGNASTATKVGTATVGGTAKPIYLKDGAPTALSATVGGVTKPVYMNAGTVTALSGTVGGTAKPVYMNAGTITALSDTIGGTATPVYVNSGTLTAMSGTIGSENIPVYLKSGVITSTGKSFANYLPLTGGTLNSKAGTAGTNGATGLIVGNKTSIDTAGNSYGRIALFGKTNKGDTAAHSTWITPARFTADREHTLPDATGYLATGSTSGVGSASVPVYMSASGVLTACTSLSYAMMLSRLVNGTSRTKLYSTSGGLDNGTITLSDDFTKYKYLVICHGHDDPGHDLEAYVHDTVFLNAQMSGNTTLWPGQDSGTASKNVALIEGHYRWLIKNYKGGSTKTKFVFHEDDHIRIFSIWGLN